MIVNGSSCVAASAFVLGLYTETLANGRGDMASDEKWES